MLCYAFVHLFRSLERGPYWKLFWLKHFLFCQFQYLYIPVCYCIWFIDKMFGGPVILWRIEILGFVPAWDIPKQCCCKQMQWNMHHLFDLLHLLIPSSEIIFLSKIWWEDKEDLQQWIIWRCSKVWSYHHLNMRRKIVKESVRTSWIWACLQLGLLVSSLRGFQLTGLATSSRTRDCFLISLRREKTGAFRFSLLKTGNCGDLSFFVACVSYSCNADSNSLQTARQASFVVDRD
jgi:hypothetical protein